MYARGGFPAGSEIAIYEEVKPNQVERLEDLDQPLEKVLDELMDGDILVFERTESNDVDLELPTAKDYFKYVGLSMCSMSRVRAG